MATNDRTFFFQHLASVHISDTYKVVHRVGMTTSITTYASSCLFNIIKANKTSAHVQNEYSHSCFPSKPCENRLRLVSIRVPSIPNHHNPNYTQKKRIVAPTNTCSCNDITTKCMPSRSAHRISNISRKQKRRSSNPLTGQDGRSK